MLRLKELRQKEKISQQALAEIIGVSRSTVSMWETGSNQPDNDTLGELADYFGVSVDYLLFRTDDPVDYENGDLIASIPSSYLEGCNGDVKKAVAVMRSVDEDAQRENACCYEDFARNPVERKVLMLARHLEKIPDGKRERIIKNFEDTIDTYLEAMGMGKEEGM